VQVTRAVVGGVETAQISPFLLVEGPPVGDQVA
jgi:hypothetical protein